MGKEKGEKKQVTPGISQMKKVLHSTKKAKVDTKRFDLKHYSAIST